MIFFFFQEPIENDEIVVDDQKTSDKNDQEDASEKTELIKKIKESNSKLDKKGEKIITKEVAASGAVNDFSLYK
jgi:hypothetical protein